MDPSANQWLSELETGELGELASIDPLSMQQLAESLADELRHPVIPQEQEKHHYAPPPCNPYHHASQFAPFQSFESPLATGSSFGSATVKAEGGPAASIFTFSGPSSLNFSGEQWQDDTASFRVSEKRGSLKASANAQEHVIAERKRREKLQQQFMSLASTIPDLKKTDKMSILGSTIDYIKQLEDQVKALQDQSTKSTAESPMFETRCCIATDDQQGASSPRSNPKVEASVRGTTVLLRICSEEKKGVLIMVLSELEKHGLSIMNTNVVPFTDSTLNITITAEIEDGYSTTVELVKNLNLALRNFK